ncbi:MAG: hypothetical protein AAGI38_11650, partial [Bacteroidota bacterium]
MLLTILPRWLFTVLGVIVCCFLLKKATAQSGISFENGHKITSYVEPDKFFYDFDWLYNDAEGYMWIINMTDLYRYDGKEFERFD